MSARSSNWSITINNPTPEETQVMMPSGWKLSGQYEVGENGTPHFQGHLKTPQSRFSRVKEFFPRAHIEAARSAAALEKYVHKEETRVGEFAGRSVPTIFEYQQQVAQAWDEHEFRQLTDHHYQHNRDAKRDIGDVALSYVDTICATYIEEGARGLEFISVNPMWRSSWKKFYASIIKRNACPSPPSQEAETRITQTGAGEEQQRADLGSPSEECSSDNRNA